MLTGNRAIYDAVRDAGGTLYPVGSIQLTADDWLAHYGPRMPRLRAVKQQYDPSHLFGDESPFW